MKPHIGIIGLGIMGGAMAEALIGAGYRLSGYDVHPAAGQRKASRRPLPIVMRCGSLAVSTW